MRGRPKGGKKAQRKKIQYPCSTCGKSVKKAACVQCTMCQMWCHAGCTGRETIDDCGIDFVCPKCKKGGEGEDDIILENIREDEEEKDKNKDESRKRKREKKAKKTKMMM